MFASRGEITPPWGVPWSLRLIRGLSPGLSGGSATGASSHSRMSLSTEPSTTRIWTHAISCSCGIASKYPLRSASYTALLPSRRCWRISSNAWWAERPGRNVGAILKIGFKDRLQDQEHRHLHDSIFDRWDAQWPHLAIGLGDVHPFDRRRPVALGAKFPPDFCQQVLHTVFLPFDLLEADAIHSRCSCVGAHSAPRCQQRVRVHHSAIQTVKTEFGFLFGLLSQLLSQSSDSGRQHRLGRSPDVGRGDAAAQ